MTREVAIIWLLNLKNDIGKPKHQDLWHYEQAIDEIIQTLHQEPNEDCISRQELLERCDFVIQKGIANNNGYHMISAEKVKEVIESLPPIEALEQEETLQNLTEPNKSDLISRQAILNLAKEGKLLSGNIYKKASDYINELPSAEPKSGIWIEHEWAEESEGLLIPNYECSNCHMWERNDSDYCPNCGARMESDGE